MDHNVTNQSDGNYLVKVDTLLLCTVLCRHWYVFIEYNTDAELMMIWDIRTLAVRNELSYLPVPAGFTNT